jgi:hypothetical protein
MELKIGKAIALDFEEQERKNKERRAKKKAEKTRIIEETMQ